jgi:isocitrate dehydrogenase (NAD+)
VTLKPISRTAARRVARAALRYAREHGRRRVTVVHKATVMRATDAVFLAAAREVADGGIALDDRLVDTVCHDLVVRPGSCDVLLTPMLYGDLLSDLCAGLVGGLGLAPGANVGDRHAVFEAVHGTVSHAAGRDRANPMALILSGAMLLRHVGEQPAAERVEAAVAAVLADGRTLTYDLTRGRADATAASTTEVTESVIAALESPRGPSSARKWRGSSGRN